jgi:hypothetical protein
MAKITEVEMIMGRENQEIYENRIPSLEKKDSEKLSIARDLGVHWLEYPCSRPDDNYSRLDLTFTPDGCPDAGDLESRLENVRGVSEGDARQIVSLIYGHCYSNGQYYKPIIDYLLTEDKRLLSALNSEKKQRRLLELNNIEVSSVSDFMSKMVGGV